MSQLNAVEYGHTVQYTMTLANSVDPENFEKFKKMVIEHANRGILEERNQHQMSIPRIAGFYGRLHILQWLISEYPQVLSEGSTDSLSLPISIARSCFQVMEIEFGSQPQLLQLQDKVNQSATEIDFTNGILRTLGWLINQYPAVLENLGNDAFNMNYFKAVLKVVEAKDWIRKQQVSADGKPQTINESAGQYEALLSARDLERFKAITHNLVSFQEKVASSDLKFFVSPIMSGFVNELKQLQGRLESGYEAKEKDLLRLIFIMTPFKNASWANLNPERVKLIQGCIAEFSAILNPFENRAALVEATN
jgi:hypothetical protein